MSRPNTGDSSRPPSSRRKGKETKLRTKADAPPPVDWTDLQQFDDVPVGAFVTPMPGKPELPNFPREASPPKLHRYDRPHVGTPRAAVSRFPPAIDRSIEPRAFVVGIGTRGGRRRRRPC